MDKTIEESIAEAIDKKELQAYYQPKYDAITGKIVGAEALVRWIKESGDIIPPALFIPALEQTEAVNQVDWCILEQACATVLELREGLNGCRRHSTEEIGQMLGMSRGRAEQLYRKALHRLRCQPEMLWAYDLLTG